VESGRNRMRMLGPLILLCYSPAGSMHRFLAIVPVIVVVFAASCSPASDSGDGGVSSSSTSSSSSDLGNPCTASGACSTGVCLGVGSNFENVPGLCSLACQSSADCPGSGACLPDPSGTFATACFRKCASASECLGGLPCVWLAQAASGVCIPIATNICAAGGSTACIACAANACCNEYQDCLTSVGCGKDLASCATSACLSKIFNSGNSVESALGACLAQTCVGSCP
jgi:hypothetical protein